ncbi:CoA transferase, partial [Acinetobacter baumannii]
LGIADDDAFAAQHDRRNWPQQKEKLAAIFAQRTRAEWCAVMEATDACFAPVLSMTEAPNHPHNRATDPMISRALGGRKMPKPDPHSAIR